MVSMGEVKASDLEKLNLKVGVIKSAKPHPKTSDYILLVDISSTGADKQIVVDLKESYSMDELLGKKVICIDNAEPVVVEGIESIGWLLVTYKEGKPVLLQPPEDICTGAKVCGLSNVEVEYHEE